MLRGAGAKNWTEWEEAGAKGGGGRETMRMFSLIWYSTRSLWPTMVRLEITNSL